VFLHLVGSAYHVVHSSAFRPRNVDALFFLLGWAQYGSDKKRTGKRGSEPVFLHPVGSAGNVVHYGAFRREMLMHYFSLSGGPGVVSIKSAMGHVTSNLCFYI
jgi:hypothetical protein